MPRGSEQPVVFEETGMKTNEGNGTEQKVNPPKQEPLQPPLPDDSAERPIRALR